MYVTRGESPDSKRAILRFQNQNGEYLTSIKSGKCIATFQHMTERIQSIEPCIRPPWWMLKAKTRVEKPKDNAKHVDDKTQIASELTRK
jgi:hypothetical protein